MSEIEFPVNTAWVWPQALEPGVNLNLEIRHEFTVASAPKESLLRIAADCRYAVWLNGELIGTGPFPDWPETRSVDEWDVASHLREGQNVLAVLIHQMGQDTSTYAVGDPGVLYALTGDSKPLALSGASNSQWRLSTSYRSGPIPITTPQLSFTYEYDATGDDGWRESECVFGEGWSAFDESDGRDWQETGWRFRARPLPVCELLDRLPATITAQGVFKRASSDGSVAARMQHDWLSSLSAPEFFNEIEVGPVTLTGAGFSLKPGLMDAADGVYIVVDLGRESVGYLELEVIADAGVQIDIAHGEHLDDLRVRASVGGRNFASAYRCREGRQTFLYPVTRIGGRYLQLHVSGGTGDFTLIYAGARKLRYPVPQRGAFDSPDRMQKRIHSVSVDTLRLCMHDHYDDCPWREQALYANDMLIQTLAGYYAFGEYRFPQVSLELLAGGLNPDGILELCAPARVPIAIPAFTMAWIVAVERNLHFSGDSEFARAMFPTVKTILTTWTEQMTDGLMPSFQGARYWHFYDWTPGDLDGVVRDCTGFTELKTLRFDAPLNAFLVLGLDAGAALAEAAGDTALAAQWREAVAQLRAAFHKSFWKPEEGLYVTILGECREPDTRAELTQSLALCAGCCPDAEAEALRQRLLSPDSGLVPTALGQSFWKYEALFQSPELGMQALNDVDSFWSSMLERNATSFWETQKGGWDFHAAGSLCHGWSASPAYYYGAYVLGIRPIDVGFKSFSVTPPVVRFYDGISGTIPTPAGAITVVWERVDGKAAVRLSHPDTIRAVPSSEVRILN
ncbi:family 78 glycoside hydrolase catalytic domain [Coraliomargarita parva]|uniref:family 78 glycoside hydrolase catalytic domain n=1 Tax=Coraliomargarita parva TaxID=3014050 RepID=UPI0022B40E81|nr:family 78 glycoside hydrolase catalytic domain [Coraliomargarita parva]